MASLANLQQILIEQLIILFTIKHKPRISTDIFVLLRFVKVYPQMKKPVQIFIKTNKLN